MLLTEKAARPICAHRGQGDLGHRADSEPQQEKCHARKPVEYREIRVKDTPPYVALCQRKGACDPKKGCNCSTGQSCRDRGNGIDRERWPSDAFEECAGNSRRDAGEHGIDEAMHGGKLPGSADNAQHAAPHCNDPRAVAHRGSYESCAASLPRCVPGPATGFCGHFLVSHQVRARLSFVCHILSLAPTSSSSRISQIFRNRSW